MKVGIIGAGHIAVKMANTLNLMRGTGGGPVEAYGIASRDLARAEVFAEKNRVQRAFGSYEALLEDPAVDLVYVAVPHSHHYPVMKLCLGYGKNILCEKPFTINAAQAREILDGAREKKIFVAEALWSRYLPMRKILEKVLASGLIGKVTAVTANLCYVGVGRERYVKRELAGGALLDLGVYPLSFALLVLGTGVKEISSHVTLFDTGVDAQSFTSLIYPNGAIASIYTSMINGGDKRGMIYGDKGYIEYPNTGNCSLFHVYDSDGQLVSSHYAPKQLTGFEYQVESCRRSIEAGLTEPPEIPHAETIRTMEIMDDIRRLWGMKYPEEE
ncbi:MAG: Gfo/Idh/MocA family oxidoreductase [Treponema sp.]|jgi:predicted dehydrogenase|nr:Gfo/Idh/MocA family oxidoreductase [Treponema sp.]